MMVTIHYYLKSNPCQCLTKRFAGWDRADANRLADAWVDANEDVLLEWSKSIR
jgi:hypothetical protein